VELRMRRLSVLAVALFLLACCVARAADKPQDLIIGTWTPAGEGGKSKIEFQKDGKLKAIGDQLTVEGSYKFLDDKTLEMKVVFGGKEETVRVKVTVTKDELVTKKEGADKEEKFTRVAK
jgi:uncharacterized protein (TIGR03066 family)